MSDLKHLYELDLHYKYITSILELRIHWKTPSLPHKGSCKVCDSAYTPLPRLPKMLRFTLYIYKYPAEGLLETPSLPYKGSGKVYDSAYIPLSSDSTFETISNILPHFLKLPTPRLVTYISFLTDLII